MSGYERVDPDELGGSIAGPGGAYDKNAVVIDTTNAIIPDGMEVAIVGAVRDGVLDEKPIMAVLVRGRINKTKRRAEVMLMLNHDGAAALVSEVVALATRSGWGREFADDLHARLEAMP